MTRGVILLFLLASLFPVNNPRDADVLSHAEHPGLGHPEEGAGDHRHGDPDDHHESPDSPCHHHEHTCCNAGPVLGLPGASTTIESFTCGYLAIPCQAPRLLPTARELFHVPLG